MKPVYRFVNIENPEEYIDIVALRWGRVRLAGQSAGKSYDVFWISTPFLKPKAYKIETGDDPDQKASQDMRKPKDMPPPQRSLQTQKEIEATKKAPLENKDSAAIGERIVKENGC